MAQWTAVVNEAAQSICNDSQNTIYNVYTVRLELKNILYIICLQFQLEMRRHTSQVGSSTNKMQQVHAWLFHAARQQTSIIYDR
jgi:hypothetical protein